MILTLLFGRLALTLTDSGLNDVSSHWYRGFWTLLEFGMKMVLILTTGYANALSPLADKVIGRLASVARTPGSV